jgi:putative sigma-54 modulation protein
VKADRYPESYHEIGGALAALSTLEIFMKITYTGRQVELAPAQLKKLEARFAKVGKLLDGRRECEAHVILSLERHLHQAEVTVNYFNHPLVGLSSNNDLFTAIHAAIEKLEKQAVKHRGKWRDTKRTPRKSTEPVASQNGSEPAAEAETERRVFGVNHHQKRKPMTLDEAILEMDKDRDYLVYRDAETGRTSVLVRRRDGNFDLVEG